MDKNNGWNYRIIKMLEKKIGDLPQTYFYGIYEVYYTDDVPTSYSENPVYAGGESWKELEEDYRMMYEAFSKPTLIIENGKLVEIGRFK